MIKKIDPDARNLNCWPKFIELIVERNLKATTFVRRQCLLVYD